MPIVVKQYEFTETEDTAFVELHLNGVNGSKTDIYCNDLYIKVNFPPYFFEADLFDYVNPDISTAVVGNGSVKFTLNKREKGIWGSLVPDLPKDELRKRREESIARALEKAEEDKRQKAIKKREEHYQVVQRQIDVERAAREKIESAKSAEREQAEILLRDWSRQVEEKRAQGNDDEEKPVPVRVDSKLFEEIYYESEEEDENEIDMEAIRSKVKAQLNAKWKVRINQAWEEDAKKRTDDLDNPLNPDEKNPLFLRDKGTRFLKLGNFESAVNAYTAALEIDKTLLPCYNNRAVAYLKLKDYDKSCNDSTSALELINLEIQKNQENGQQLSQDLKNAKVKVLVRRGATFALANKLEAALKDYKEALRLEPFNEAIKADIGSIESRLQKQ
ncbi:Dynein assembly factor 4, axonemal [Chytridiales sp. JEL 0842]|nr:Dynein assembly factor 4, axonemal [Chytridiales sp. JEL 0842]